MHTIVQDLFHYSCSPTVFGYYTGNMILRLFLRLIEEFWGFFCSMAFLALWLCVLLCGFCVLLYGFWLCGSCVLLCGFWLCGSCVLLYGFWLCGSCGLCYRFWYYSSVRYFSSLLALWLYYWLYGSVAVFFFAYGSMALLALLALPGIYSIYA